MPPPRIDNATYRKFYGEDPPPPATKAPTKRRGRMNKWEAEFARDHLDPLRTSGAILRYAYEPMTLRVLSVESDGPHRADTKYTPDFVAWLPIGSTVVYELKGHERAKDFLRFKMAAAAIPEWTFVLVKRGECGGWTFETFGRRG